MGDRRGVRNKKVLKGKLISRGQGRRRQGYFKSTQVNDYIEYDRNWKYTLVTGKFLRLYGFTD